MIKYISSRENKIVKQTISLQKKSSRQKLSLFVAEGKRISQEALLWAKDSISYFLISESFNAKNPDFTDGFETYMLPDDLFSKVCETENPQGILCVIKFLSASSSLSSNVLILDEVSEPGNMGTILRTADAMGFKSIFITKGSADIYNSKVIRSTMGSIFRLNFHFEEDYAFINKLKEKEYKILSAALKNSVSLEETPVFSKNAIVIGNEANGISREILSMSDIITKIDMIGNAESLNAGVAAGIIMYKYSKVN